MKDDKYKYPPAALHQLSILILLTRTALDRTHLHSQSQRHPHQRHQKMFHLHPFLSLRRQHLDTPTRRLLREPTSVLLVPRPEFPKQRRAVLFVEVVEPIDDEERGEELADLCYCRVEVFGGEEVGVRHAFCLDAR